MHYNERTTSEHKLFHIHFWQAQGLEEAPFHESMVWKLNSLIGSTIFRLDPGDAVFIHHHHQAPGLPYTNRTFLPFWRQLASNQGCRFFTFSTVRDSVDRSVSQLLDMHHGASFEELRNHARIDQAVNNNFGLGYILVNMVWPNQMQINLGYDEQQVEMALEELSGFDLVVDVSCHDYLLNRLADITGFHFARMHSRHSWVQLPEEVDSDLRQYFSSVNHGEQAMTRRVKHLDNYIGC
uniref:Uncharacterized protein n=1 Tax=Tetraselmis sp. GSL018 TaxID=582737 RepID=A0A061R1N5_9CHLO|mmetsp:Transcript_38354/g.90972  ORF Transcript_38354/g.90972 Transcript_38354/m.90972 type:complete len:238 (+) Transcript_38354:427-1140(+)|eukprot:CAMPEP_0177598944 /NCGR_PEP_ID=MMETSP0419_2-20121207/12689_1 /TAXON_ID=582737 /ORGANISM="Tetraselmis sp., Strain GSL018" /LENGTH=237 /DNA_ID=CAMNT_0019091563 /DNA_START=406 /DNA_END=1119 /DNA_ORIENTATION=+